MRASTVSIARSRPRRINRIRDRRVRHPYRQARHTEGPDGMGGGRTDLHGVRICAVAALVRRRAVPRMDPSGAACRCADRRARAAVDRLGIADPGRRSGDRARRGDRRVRHQGCVGVVGRSARGWGVVGARLAGGPGRSAATSRTSCGCSSPLRPWSNSPGWRATASRVLDYGLVVAAVLSSPFAPVLLALALLGLVLRPGLAESAQWETAPG